MHVVIKMLFAILDTLPKLKLHYFI